MASSLIPRAEDHAFPDAQARTIFVDTDALRATDFNLPDDRKFLPQRPHCSLEIFDKDGNQQPWDFASYISTHRN